MLEIKTVTNRWPMRFRRFPCQTMFSDTLRALDEEAE
jgi:hypothetical protein